MYHIINIENRLNLCKINKLPDCIGTILMILNH